MVILEVNIKSNFVVDFDFILMLVIFECCIMLVFLMDVVCFFKGLFWVGVLFMMFDVVCFDFVLVVCWFDWIVI